MARLINKIKERLIFHYYKILCLLFSKNEHSPPKILFKSERTLLRARIKGRVTNVGYEKWIIRHAREKSLTLYTYKRRQNTIEVILIGQGNTLEVFIKTLWKGSLRSKVQDIKVQWLNKPESMVEEKEGHEEENLQELAAFERIIQENLKIMKPIIQQPNSYELIEEITNTSEIYRSATELGLKTIKEGSLNYIKFKDHTLGYQQSQSARVSTLIRSVTDHKHITKEILKSFNIPVPEGRVFGELEEAKEYLEKFKNGAVVKPLEGSYGQGITVGVYNETQLERGWNYAKEFHKKIILEELIQGIDIRVLVIHGRAQVAMSRLPANVIGDGQRSIEELIKNKNKIRFKNPRLSKALIIVDEELKSFLKGRGQSLEDIPPKGEIVFLNMKGNIGSGADSINITPYVNKDLLSIAEEAAEILGVIDYWGVDLLVENIAKNRMEQNCGIIEMNARANIFNVRFPMYGEPFDASLALIKGELFKEVKENTNQSREVLKDIDHIIPIQDDLWRIQKGRQVGYTSIRQSSFFADKACGERILAKKILKEKGIPVPDDKKFKTLKEVKRFLKKNPNYKKIITVYSYKSQEKMIHSLKEYDKIYKKGKETYAKFYLLEEVIPGERIELLVQGSKILERIKEQENAKLHPDYERLAIKAVQAIPGMNLAMVQIISEDLSSCSKDIHYQVTNVSPYINYDKIPLLQGKEGSDKIENVLTELFIENDILWIGGN